MKNLTGSDYRVLHRQRQSNTSDIINYLYSFVDQVGVMHKSIENEANEGNQDFYDRFKTVVENDCLVIKF